MAPGLDRLERLFALKRKASAVSVTEPNSPVSQNSEPVFPSPSFLRPKAVRMTAREEVRLNQPSGRSQSATGAVTPRRSPSSKGRSSSSTKLSSPVRKNAQRLSSYSDDHRDSVISSLLDYKFPRPPTQGGEPLPLLVALDPETSSELSGRRSPRSYSPFEAESLPKRLDTPPSTDPEDDEPSPKRLMNKKLPTIPCPGLLTPEASPTLGPAPGPPLRESRLIDILDKALYRDIQLRLGEPVDACSIRRSFSQSSLVPSSRNSYSDSSLREPEFDEFMGLSDEDIAEERPLSVLKPSNIDLPPTPPSTSEAEFPTRPCSLFTLTTSPTIRPAAAAAFEIRRIANRYNFDFVYVVNLRQESTVTPVKDAQSAIGPCVRFHESREKMAGRLMAAYGLQHVASPFRISESTQKKVLQSEGWLEYHSHKTRRNEFARGYARAFYPRRYTRSGSVDSNSSSSSTSSTRSLDLGIVFAAYRLPRADGTIRFSDKGELRRVHCDAENLVNMLLDFNKANMVRRH